MSNPYNIYEIKDFYALVYHMKKRIDQLLLADSKRHMMDAEPSWVIDLINDSLVPVLEEVIDRLDDFPGDEVLCDEPPLTAAEMHSAAWKEHLELHS